MCNKAYATGRKVAVNFKEQMGIIFDEELSQWNDRIPPTPVPVGVVI
jgi:hypothetical protein